jgi:hypothetical protein
MTTPVNDRVTFATGDGVQTVFLYDFPSQDEDELIVVVDNVEISSSLYAVDLVAKSITFTTAPVDLAAVAIAGNTSLAQLIQYSRSTNSFQLSALEGQLDRMVDTIQELRREDDRTLKTRYGVPGPDVADLEAGKLLLVNAAGDAIEMGPTADAISSAQANAEQTALDRIQTGLDVTQTGLDVAAAEAAAQEAREQQKFFTLHVLDSTEGDPATAYAAGNIYDDVTLVAGQKVCRATASGDPQDGVWLVPATGAATRIAPLDVYDNIAGCMFTIMLGTVNGQKLFQCKSEPGGTIDVTAILIEEFSSGAGSSTILDLGTTADIATTTVAAGIQKIQTTGYAAALDGGAAVWERVGSEPSHPGKRQSADTAWWELSPQDRVDARQLGAVGDDSTDNATALQNWLDAAAALDVEAWLPAGIFRTATALTLNDNQSVNGLHGKSVLKWASYVASNLISATAKENVLVENITFQTIAFSNSTSSVTIGTGAKSFTVDAGMGYSVSDNIVVIPNVTLGDGKNYMQGTVTSYDNGTGALVLNVTTSLGSGTFANWVVTRFNGESLALSFSGGSTDCRVNNCIVDGRFYTGLRTQNSNSSQITNNLITGVINRPIYIYGTSGTDDGAKVSGNTIRGAGLTQYGINVNGSTAGACTDFLISFNEIEQTVFQAIEAGGAVSGFNIIGNTCDTAYSTAAAGIVVQYANSLTPQRGSVVGNSVHGYPSDGILVNSCFRITVSGNNIWSCGYGVRVQSGATTSYYNPVNNNTIDSCTADGIYYGASSSGFTGQSPCIGNNITSCTGWGINSNGNTTKITFTANVSLSNGSGNATIGGVSHVNDPSNIFV